MADTICDVRFAPESGHSFDQWRPKPSKLSACAPVIVDPSTLQTMALSLSDDLQLAGRNEMTSPPHLLSDAAVRLPP